MAGSQSAAESGAHALTDDDPQANAFLDDFQDLPPEQRMVLYAELQALSEGCDDSCNERPAEVG